MSNASWMLEDLVSKRGYLLKNGSNIIGRHSSCDIKLNSMVSRRHAEIKITEDSDNIQICCLSATNVITINGSSVRNGYSQPLREQDVIRMGASAFILKRSQLTEQVDTIIELSSDEDESTTHKEQNSKNLPKSIHLPKISAIKQEYLNKLSENIKDVFGEPDEELLKTIDSSSNPYLFNNLNKDLNCTPSTSRKQLYSGEFINLTSDDEQENIYSERNPNAAMDSVQNIKKEINCYDSGENSDDDVIFITSSDDEQNNENVVNANTGSNVWIKDGWNKENVEKWTTEMCIDNINAEIASLLGSAEPVFPKVERSSSPEIEEPKRINSDEDSETSDADAGSTEKLTCENVSEKDLYSDISEESDLENTVLKAEIKHTKANKLTKKENKLTKNYELLAEQSTNSQKQEVAQSKGMPKEYDRKESQIETKTRVQRSHERRCIQIKTLPSPKRRKKRHHHNIAQDKYPPKIQKVVSADFKKKLTEERKAKLKTLTGNQNEPTPKKETPQIHSKCRGVKITLKNRGSFLTELPYDSKSLENNENTLKDDEFGVSDMSTITETIETSIAALENPDSNELTTYTTPSRLTFASLEKDFKEREESERMFLQRQKLREQTAQSSCTEDQSSIQSNQTATGATKKVTTTFTNYMSTRSSRRQKLRETYKILNKDEEARAMLLQWCNEWQLADSSKNIHAVPDKFLSFEKYKSAQFDIMKANIQERIEKAQMKQANAYLIEVDEIKNNGAKSTIITKPLEFRGPVFEMVLLKFGDKVEMSTFAFLENCQNKKHGLYFVYLCLDSQLTAKYKTIQVVPMLENIRNELMSLKTLLEIENSPLMKPIIDPSVMFNTDFKGTLASKTSYKGYHKLDDDQKDSLIGAYHRIIYQKAPSITIIKGPPATGKTEVITNLVLQLLYGNEVRNRDYKILVCALNNSVVDVICKKLKWISEKMCKDIKFRVLRFGTPKRIEPSILPISLAHHIKTQINTMYQHTLQQLKGTNVYNEFVYLDGELKRLKDQNRFENEYNEKSLRLNEIRKALTPRLSMEQEQAMSTHFVENAHVICTTLASCHNLFQFIDYFDVCIMDEAAQVNELVSLYPLKFGISSLVLVGNDKQSPSPLSYPKAVNDYLRPSLFSRIDRLWNEANNVNFEKRVCNDVYKLTVQHRMHPELCLWPNAFYYNNEIENSPKTRLIETTIAPWTILKLSLSSTALEDDFFLKLLTNLNAHCPPYLYSYGFISSSKTHAERLYRLIRIGNFTKILISTVDGFISMEKDVVIVHADDDLLSNDQKFSLAVTRAKKCTIICGEAKSEKAKAVWKHLTENAKARCIYFELKDAHLSDLHSNLVTHMLPNPII